AAGTAQSCNAPLMTKTKTVVPHLVLALIGAVGIASGSAADSIAIDDAATRLQVTSPNRSGPKPQLILYTTMATWCVPCKTELPQFSFLRSTFKPEELAMFGLPYDDKEGSERLKAWAAANRPSYELLADLKSDNIASVKTMVSKKLSVD